MICRGRNAVNFVPFARNFVTVDGNCDFFITTPIFYVNSAPHIGHLHTALIADAAHRFKELIGFRSTIYSTGTDEHGVKIQQAASASNTPIQQFCDNISSEYSKVFKDYDIKYTNFIRTSDERHKEAAQHFWKTLVSNGHITKGSYKGWYCDADESFLGENQLKIITENGKEIKVSAESGRPVHWVEEINYKFNLPYFENELLTWLKPDVIKPKKFHKQVTTWIDEGLMTQDVSVSRPKSRVFWGTSVPGDEEQTIYVWLDALVNYLTVVGYPALTAWPPDVQLLGKDILKFHGIYWPAFLIAANLEPPRSLIVHSHWTIEGEKMSKSKGNVICPNIALKKFTACGLRYFLLREATLSNDSNYSETKVTRVLNAELADTIGNLLNRCCGPGVNEAQYFPPFIQEDFDKYCRDTGADLVVAVNRLQDEVGLHYSEFNFYKGIAAIVGALREANRFFETSRPWELKKKPNSEKELDCIVHLTLESLRIAGVGLQPVIPSLADALLSKLGVGPLDRAWHTMLPSWDRDSSRAVPLAANKVLLFQKIQPGQPK